MNLLSNISKPIYLTLVAILIFLRVSVDTIFYFILPQDSFIFSYWTFFSSILILSAFIYYFFSEQFQKTNIDLPNEKFVFDFTRIFYLQLFVYLLIIFLPNNDKIYSFELPYFNFLISDISTIFFALATIYLAWFMFIWLTRKKHKRTNLYLKIIAVLLTIILVGELANYGFFKSIYLSEIISLFLLAIYIFSLLVTKKNNWIAQLERKPKIRLLWISLANIVLSLLLAVSVIDSEGFLSRNTINFLSGANNFFGAVVLALNAFSLRIFLAVIFSLPTATIVERKTSEIFSLTYLNKFIAETTTKNPDEILQMVTQLALNASGSAAVWLEVYNNGTIDVGATAQISPELIKDFHSDKRIGNIFTTIDKPVLVESVPENEEIKSIINYFRFANTLIAIPLYQGAKRFGTIVATDTEEFGFEPEDVAVLSAFADNVNLALENHRLLQESIQKERYRSEMLIAKRIQKELLPQNLPEFSKFQLAAYSSPAEEVGGDYYDVARFADGTPCVLVGDVSGKGMSAAFYMAQLKGAVHSVAPQVQSPKELLIKLNSILFGLMDKQSYITLNCLKLDEINNSVSFARAGHPPLFWKHSSNVDTIKPQGLGIALVGNELFANYIEEVNVQLTDCDILLLITDGVNEIRNSSGEEFDFQRISDFLASHNSSAQKLLNQFLQNINDFKGDAPQIDDLTIFVVSFSSNKNKRSINE